MTQWLAVVLMVAAGTLIAFQSPINATMARRTGLLEASLISFTVGTAVALTLVLALGKGSVRHAWGAPAWNWLGGALGMVYVSLLIYSVPRIGVTAAMVAGLVGQLATGLFLDHFGLLGLPERQVGPARLLGIGVLFLGLWLIQGRR